MQINRRSKRELDCDGEVQSSRRSDGEGFKHNNEEIENWIEMEKYKLVDQRENWIEMEKYKLVGD